MSQLGEAPYAYDERKNQAVPAAAHPQLCGSWPGDEWPDVSAEQAGRPVNLCASFPAVYPGEVWFCAEQSAVLRSSHCRSDSGCMPVSTGRGARGLEDSALARVPVSNLPCMLPVQGEDA